MTAANHREIHDVEQAKKMVPLITRETTFCQFVRKLALGVNIFDLDLGVQINSVQQPIKRNSVASGNIPQRWTYAFDDHVGHRFIVFESVQLSFTLRRTCVCDHVTHM